MESIENDAGRILGIVAGAFYIVGAAFSVAMTLAFFNFFSILIPLLPSPPVWTLVLDFVWGAATGLVIIFVSLKYSGSLERRTRVISGIIIIVVALIGFFPTGGGAWIGIALALAAGIVTIVHKNSILIEH